MLVANSKSLKKKTIGFLMNLEAICRWTSGLYFDVEHQSQSHNNKIMPRPKCFTKASGIWYTCGKLTLTTKQVPWKMISISFPTICDFRVSVFDFQGVSWLWKQNGLGLMIYRLIIGVIHQCITGWLWLTPLFFPVWTLGMCQPLYTLHYS